MFVNLRKKVAKKGDNLAATALQTHLNVKIL